MDNRLDEWRTAARAPAYTDPPPDERGLVFAQPQAHTVPQVEAAGWLCEALFARRAGEVDDAVAILAGYRGHLTPLCQLAGAVHAAACLRYVGRAELLKFVTGRAGAPSMLPPWLAELARQTAGATPVAVLGAFDSLLRHDEGEDDRARVSALSADDAVLTFAGLVDAAADTDTVAVNTLLGEHITFTRLWPAALRGVLRLACAVGQLLEVPPYAALGLASGKRVPIPILDIAEALRRDSGRV